jgi:sporulation protein YlmC with PRC-barrel domain
MKEDKQPRVLSATSLIGSEVRNPKGEHLGTIIELMLDVDTGQVAYAVLAVGEFLGLGEKLFALPWIALAVDTKRRCFLLDVDKEWLKSAAGFHRHAWPEMPDRRFVHNHYGHVGAVRHDEPDAVGI